MVINGYRIETTDMDKLEQVLDMVRRRLNKIISKGYHRKLSEEIEFLVDNIALNNIKRDPDTSILESAKGNVRYMMENARRNDLCVPYNFSIYINLLPHEGCTYLKVLCCNEELLSAFEKNPALENVSLNEQECSDPKNGKFILWQKLHAKYKNKEAAVVRLDSEPVFDKEKLKFASVEDRAKKRARYQVQNHLLNQIAGGEIPPVRLMDMMDEMLVSVLSDSAEEQILDAEIRLKKILPKIDLNSDIVFKSLKETEGENVEEETKEE